MRRIVALAVCCMAIAGVFMAYVVTQHPTLDHVRPSTAPDYRVSVGTATVDAEAADTPPQRESGLMNRTGLAPNAGMLFVFPHPELQSIWMKNMRFSLDIVFITQDQRVLQVYSRVPPCAAEPCPVYTSDGPALYVLEVNAGFCAQHKIVRGAPVTITPS